MSEAHFSFAGIRVWFGARIESVRTFNRLLIDNWKQVLLKAWSIRISILLVILGVVFTLMTLVSDWMQKIVGPWLFSIAFLIIGVTVGLARVLKQPGVDE